MLAEEVEEAKAGHDGGLLHVRPGREALLLHGRSGVGGLVLRGSFPGEAWVGRHMQTWAYDD